VLLVIMGFVIHSCNQIGEQTRIAEANRRASLSPDQRAAEDKAAADAAAKETDEEELKSLRASASVYSENCVRACLKHPDDASFGFWDVPDVGYNKDRTIFSCSSKVKAMNDFGAELTYRWETILYRDAQRWTLVSCTIDGKVVYADERLLDKLRQPADGSRP